MPIRLVEIGEYGLHTWLRTTLGSTSGELDEPGDDCAFLDLLPNDYLLVTSDRLPLNITGEYGGRLVVTQSFCDIVSKGGTPIAFLLDVFLPREATLEEFEAIVLGAKRETARYGARIVGGDTKEDTKLTVVGVGIGVVPKPHRVSRAGARVGDVLALTLAGREPLGARWAKIVVDALRADVDAETRGALERSYARDFQIPAREMQAAVRAGFVTAAMDNSDGLGGSLTLIGLASGIGFILDRVALLEALDPLVAPVAAALATDPLRFMFAPGYDWQCVVTVERAGFELTRRVVREAGGDLLPIGEVTADTQMRLRDGRAAERRLTLFGDEKFKLHPWHEQPRHWLEFELTAPA